jgi:YggT family protein
MLILANARDAVANYLSTLIYVYIIVIFLYILLNMMFSLGLRPPYSRALNTFLSFLRDVSEPYLRLFRRIIPSVGMFDFSPMVALIVLVVLDQVLYNAIHT